MMAFTIPHRTPQDKSTAGWLGTFPRLTRMALPDPEQHARVELAGEIDLAIHRNDELLLALVRPGTAGHCTGSGT